MSDDVRVGLVGAGPWARFVHGPVLAATPGIDLATVWARRPEAAAELATAHGATVAPSIEALLDDVDAVAFAVPPDVQADLAPTAARAGKHLLLEKPLGADLDGARRLADTIGDHGVASQVVFSWRYAAEVRAALAQTTTRRLDGGVATFLHGSAIDGPFRTPWRVEHGPLLDLGPHLVDLLDAALGPVVEVRARGDRQRWVNLQLVHDGGAVSTATMSSHVAGTPRISVELAGDDGILAIDLGTAVGIDAYLAVGTEFERTARGIPHPLDAAHALRIQQVLEQASADLGG